MISPTFVQANWPTLLGVNRTVTADLACPATRNKVISTIAVDVIASYATLDRVDSIIAADEIAGYATLDRV